MCLFDKNNKPDQWLKRPFKDNLAQALSQKMRTPDQIRKLLDDPELRFCDYPQFINLANMLIRSPDDPDLQDILSQFVGQNRANAAASGDEFYGSYPPLGTVTYPPDFIALGKMPTQGVVGMSVSQCVRNVLFAGPAGSGKTTCFKSFVSNPRLFTTTRCVVFGKKREMRGLLDLPNRQGYVTVFQCEELILSLQPPGGVKENVWCHDFAQFTGRCYGRYSSHKFMSETLEFLLKHRPYSSYPTLSNLIEAIAGLKPHFSSREMEYKESILTVLKDLYRCCGSIFEYGSSDFLEVLFSTPGLAVIEVETLPQEHLTWLVTFFARWLYNKRIYQGA